MGIAGVDGGDQERSNRILSVPCLWLRTRTLTLVEQQALINTKFDFKTYFILSVSVHCLEGKQQHTSQPPVFSPSIRRDWIPTGLILKAEAQKSLVTVTWRASSETTSPGGAGRRRRRWWCCHPVLPPVGFGTVTLGGAVGFRGCVAGKACYKPLGESIGRRTRVDTRIGCPATDDPCGPARHSRLCRYSSTGPGVRTVVVGDGFWEAGRCRILIRRSWWDRWLAGGNRIAAPAITQILTPLGVPDQDGLPVSETPDEWTHHVAVGVPELYPSLVPHLAWWDSASATSIQPTRTTAVCGAARRVEQPCLIDISANQELLPRQSKTGSWRTPTIHSLAAHTCLLRRGRRLDGRDSQRTSGSQPLSESTRPHEFGHAGAVVAGLAARLHTCSRARTRASSWRHARSLLIRRAYPPLPVASFCASASSGLRLESLSATLLLAGPLSLASALPHDAKTVAARRRGGQGNQQSLHENTSSWRLFAHFGQIRGWAPVPHALM